MWFTVESHLPYIAETGSWLVHWKSVKTEMYSIPNAMEIEHN